MILGLFLDPIKFLYNLYTEKERRNIRTKQSLAMTLESFNKFEEVMQEVIKVSQALQEDPSNPIYVPYSYFNIQLQTRLDCVE